MRICSLLPSATEIVCKLGLIDSLVGVTHECDYPPRVQNLPIVTRDLLDHSKSNSREIHRHISEAVHSGSSIYNLDQDLLEQLSPDLILTQELCTVCAVSYSEVSRAVKRLRADSRVISLEPRNLQQILSTIEVVGELAGVSSRAEEITAGLLRRIQAVTDSTRSVQIRPRVLCLEWLDPPFVAGHWVPEMVRLAGGSDDLGKEEHPSFEISWEALDEYDPEVTVMMPCGYNLDQTLKDYRQVNFPPTWRTLSASRGNRVFAVDGSGYFNRPGPRIVDGLEVLAEILHPRLFPARREGREWCQINPW